MTISEKLYNQLQEVLNGEPWYGDPVYTILDRISFEAAYEKPAGSVHSIAGIILHMTGWAEEVMDRMNGMKAQLPVRGDWPEPGLPDEQKWKWIVEDIKLVNVNLAGFIQDFPEEKWGETVEGKDPGQTYEYQVTGLIQHYIYHSAQIALLNRMING
ncbi:putative damage-inducible protein DinB [Mucilaginibacter oryzae]|uniref:Putative damage-inducible protein DinB n=1 Tax=Mucilaginibacter oryzae TaxID=468058 RepID=A0A316HJJ2_9SPHI|nr:DinB family protein [Mucilaginibacter oryzae]PWK80211.1 putative damage-inducible protein DinB [Mucilaginibacter oryzae]